MKRSNGFVWAAVSLGLVWSTLHTPAAENKTTFSEGTYKGRPYSDKPIMNKQWGDKPIPGDWEPVEQKALILENSRLQIKLLPEKDGKVFSIVDKATGMDMINADALFDHYPFNEENSLKDYCALSAAGELGLYDIKMQSIKTNGTPVWKKIEGKEGDGVAFTWAVLKQLVEELNAIGESKPELLMAAGDLTNRNLPAEWEYLMKHLNALGMKLFLVPGNHDSNAGSKSGGSNYEKYTGQKPFQVLDYKGVRWIGLINTDEGAEEKPAFGSTVLSDRERQWLEEQFAAKKPQYKFFVQHFHSAEWGEMLHDLSDLSARYKVTAWLEGHRHTNLHRQLNEAGTREIICPGLVGNYGHMPCSYYLVHVLGNRIVYRLKPMTTSGVYEEGPLKGLKKPSPNPVTLLYVQTQP